MILRSALLTLLTWSTLLAAEPSSQTPVSSDADILAGHSYHGEAFNEGPRQAAERIVGTGKIKFPTSTESATAQQFFEQGIGQLHGFWYLEAERSFRQAANEDPDLAIAYWGMAMANLNNPERARGLIDEAMARREDGADRREKMYIEAFDRFVAKADEGEEEKSDNDDKADEGEKPGAKAKGAKAEAKRKRSERYIADLEKILHEFPGDVEAKAFLALQLWMADRDGVKLTSRYAVNALLNEIFAVNAMHPAHHYRIHLWDSQRPENALESAARCGPSAPAIAHMWHMPGHIYSRLKRYSDAAWQQEASARVDHAHMTRMRLMPDQIHNFAHNNEWLVRNLLYVGRVDDALDLSRNLISLPRHPKYNTLQKRGSYKFGRQRLIQTLTEYELWDQWIIESGGHFLTPSEDDGEQDSWLGWLAVAQFRSGDARAGGKTLRSLRRRMLSLQTRRLDLQEQAADDGDANAAAAEESEPSGEALTERIGDLREIIARAAAAAATARGDADGLKRHLNSAKLDDLLQARWLADTGELEAAIEIAEKQVRNGDAQVRPLAVLVDLLWRHEQKERALERFAELRSVAASADLDTPLLARLAPVAEAAGVTGDWRISTPPADDLGERPSLDELGPFRWQPYPAPSWSATTADGELVSGEEFAGRPRVVIFYLGFGCLHCVEQLQAFAPTLDRWRQAGIDVIALSTESVDELQSGIENFDEKIEIPLLSDAQAEAFGAFRCWDNFERQPMHGTFLIDARGRVRWQDIGHEPFTDVEFLLQESKRLLAL